jgi:hypothetical protein
MTKMLWLILLACSFFLEVDLLEVGGFSWYRNQVLPGIPDCNIGRNGQPPKRSTYQKMNSLKESAKAFWSFYLLVNILTS